MAATPLGDIVSLDNQMLASIHQLHDHVTLNGIPLQAQVDMNRNRFDSHTSWSATIAAE
jgi:hypothetical protein